MALCCCGSPKEITLALLFSYMITSLLSVVYVNETSAEDKRHMQRFPSIFQISVVYVNETSAEDQRHMQGFPSIEDTINLRIEVTIIIVFICLVGFFGVFQKRRECLVPFLILQGLGIVTLIVFSVHMLPFQYECSLGLVIIAIIMFGFWLMVFGYYREIEKQTSTVSAV